MVFAHMLYTSETLFHEGICGDVQDTKLLVSWNDDTIVIAFRGTSSMANALADLQVAYPLPTLFAVSTGVCVATASDKQ